jgi:hypothetical protein
VLQFRVGSLTLRSVATAFNRLRPATAGSTAANREAVVNSNARLGDFRRIHADVPRSVSLSTVCLPGQLSQPHDGRYVGCYDPSGTISDLAPEHVTSR